MTYYTSRVSGVDQSQAIDTLIAQVDTAEDKAMSHINTAFPQEADSRLMNVIQHMDVDIDAWKLKGKQAKLKPQGFNATAWASQGNMFVKNLTDIPNINDESRLSSIIAAWLKSPLTPPPDKKFNWWPWLLGGGFLFVVVSAIFARPNNES